MVYSLMSHLAIAAGIVGRLELATDTASTAGSINVNTVQLFTLNGYAFYPMKHKTDSNLPVNSHMIPHTTDGASADSGRFGFYQQIFSTNQTWDMEYRWIMNS